MEHAIRSSTLKHKPIKEGKCAITIYFTSRRTGRGVGGEGGATLISPPWLVKLEDDTKANTTFWK